MGISGLLPLLKSIHKHTTLKKFAGQTLGIDGYGWLHRGSVACAIELALDKPTTKYIEFAVNRVKMLLDFGITPYVVFDGDALPSKAGTNQERRAKRNEAKALGLSLYKAGKISQAYQEFQKAASVTPQMARLLINELKKMDVQYIVAPYEADAQLAYLEQQGIINGILSEDSDLLVFGAKRLITKLNQYGECVEIERKDFPLVKEISLNGWTDDMFRRMAILSGCDYLPNIEKMGLKTAYRFVRKYKDPERLLRMVAFEGKFCVPRDYLEKFLDAELTFLHHRVFCPLQQKMVFLTEPDRGQTENDMPFLGPYVESEVAIGVACGDLNPKTKEPLSVIAPAPTKPLLRDIRRQTLGTPTELKPSKSIENFFKPHRTPLQELDPNSLTPSPSQQRLLERHRNATWEARFPNSAPPLQRARTTSFATPAASNTDRRSFLTRASTLSNYQSPKRQRLCSDADISPTKEVKKSPFFLSSGPAISPLGLKKRRRRQAGREFDVWSDDSVDEILLGLSDVQRVASPHAKRATPICDPETRSDPPFEECEVIPQSSPLRQRNIQTNKPSEIESADEEGLQSSEKEEDTSTAERTEISISSSMENTIVDDHDVAEPLTEPRKFSTLSADSQKSGRETLSEGQQPQSREDPNFSAEIHLSTRRSLAAKGMFQTPDLLKTFVYQSPKRPTTSSSTLIVKQSDATKVELGKAALESRPSQTTTFQSPPISNDILVTSQLGGSEDAIVPNSEDEISECEDVESRPMLNLGGFRFRS